jgi:hypothetical protein
MVANVLSLDRDILGCAAVLIYPARSAGSRDTQLLAMRDLANPPE